MTKGRPKVMQGKENSEQYRDTSICVADEQDNMRRHPSAVIE